MYGHSIQRIACISFVTILLFFFPHIVNSQSDKVGNLIQDLRSEDRDLRSKAAVALGELKDSRAVGPLISALKSDTWIKREAAESLGKLKDPRALNTLVFALKDEDWNVRKNAAWALGEIRETDAIEPLIAALSDVNPYVRSQAAASLVNILRHRQAYTKIKDRNWIDKLIEVLMESGIDVRIEAAETLGRMKEPRAIDPLVYALKDTDTGVRKKAITAMGEIGGKKAINPLIEKLLDWECRKESADALSRLGWHPKSDEDRVHFWVAKGNGNELRYHWNLTKAILLNDFKSNVEYSLWSFIGIGNEEIIPILIEKLNKEGTKPMAEAYLNCGHPKLGNAAREWAAKHGYTVSVSADAHHPASWRSW